MKTLQTHLINVCKYSILIGKELNLNKQQLLDLAVAARYHDIGKIRISPKILNKSGKLDKNEWYIMKQHPLYSEEILKGKGYKNEIVLAVKHHHERWDGNGYICGQKGEEIPIYSRIISIADTFDAITSDRPYSKSQSYEYAINEIVACSGTQFDPNIVPIFKEVMDFSMAIDIYLKENII